MIGAPVRTSTEAGGLPLIGIAGLESGDDAEVVRVADAIGEAARAVGFFRIRDHGIAPTVIDATYAAAERFFAQSEGAKAQYYIGRSSNHRGYVPFAERGDYPDEVSRNYEAFDLGLDLPADDVDFLSGNRLLGPNVWPDVVGFRDAVSTYYNHVSRVGRLLCSALELHLGLAPGAMTDQMTRPVSQLRLLHYVRDRQILNPKSVNMGAHTDYECLTLLHARNEGLQVMSRDDRWIDVPVDPAAFVVNIGDMLEAWTNGLLRSTPHRVLNLSPERYSLPYFMAANHDTLIEPFSDLVGPDRPARYSPFTAGAHLERMLIRDFPYLRDPKRGRSGESVNNPFETRLGKVSD